MPRTTKGNYVTEGARVLQKGADAWLGGDYEAARGKYRDAAKLYRDSGAEEGAAFVYSRPGEL